MKFLWARLMNKLFGWHYVMIPFGYSQIIARVKTLNGRGYVEAYDDWFWIDITEEGHTEASGSRVLKRCTPITYQDGDFT